jgi:ADP-ribose pyrophosphatase
MSVRTAAQEAAGAPVTTIAERLVWRSRFGSFYDDEVRFANGRTGSYFRVVHGDGYPPAVVMPMCGEYVALVRVWRHAVRAWEWGFPRGCAHGPDPEVTARAECAEEIGAEPAELLRLGEIWPESAHNDCTVIAYAARMTPDALGSTATDTEEVAGIAWVPMRQLGRLIAAGKIRDGYTLSCYGFWAAMRQEGFA